MCLAGLLTNSALALYLVPSPTAHLAGLLGALCPVLVCPLGPLLGLHQAALLAAPPAAITTMMILNCRGSLNTIDPAQAAAAHIEQPAYM